MSVSHLNALEQHLAQRGWRVVAVHPGDGVSTSASWEIQRSTRHPSLVLDFDGMDPMGRCCLPLEDSYSCTLRGYRNVSLYFRRRIVASRRLWDADVQEFVDALDRIASE